MIDPGYEITRLRQYLDDNQLTPSLILLTHGHIDHCAQAAAMADAYDVPVFVHASDQLLVENLETQAASFGLGPFLPIATSRLVNQLPVKLSGQIKLIETPGHTPGSCCFLIAQCLFSGDTLFHETVGRTDLSGGSLDALQNSVLTLYREHPDATPLYPGHGKSSTIGHEKIFNQVIPLN